MSYQLNIHDLFWNDVKEAALYYIKISPGLGGKFKATVIDVLEKIHAAPENYFNITKKYRRARLIEFPYCIIYSIKNDVVIVFTLKHEHSRSRKWMERVKDF